MKSLLVLILFSYSFTWAQGLSCLEQLKTYRERLFAKNHSEKSDEALSAGMEQVEKLISFARETREEVKQKNFDPKRTALKSLDPVVSNLAEFLSEAEAALPVWTLPSTRKLYQNFRIEASSRVNEKQVTYEWLILFSYRISILTDTAFLRKLNPEISSGYWKTHDSTVDFISRRDFFTNLFTKVDFDKVLVLPFTKDLGIYGMNRLIAQGIAPLGHIFKKAVVDGIAFTPFTFWIHDKGHAISSGMKSPNFMVFAANFLKIAENLSPEKRIQMEYLFFYFTHEAAVLNGDFTSRVKNITTALEALTKRERSHRYLTHASQDPGHFGNVLVMAGVDIKNDAAVDRWLLEAMTDFLKQVTEVDSSL